MKVEIQVKYVYIVTKEMYNTLFTISSILQLKIQIKQVSKIGRLSFWEVVVWKIDDVSQSLASGNFGMPRHTTSFVVCHVSW